MLAGKTAVIGDITAGANADISKGCATRLRPDEFVYK